METFITFDVNAGLHPKRYIKIEIIKNFDKIELKASQGLQTSSYQKKISEKIFTIIYESLCNLKPAFLTPNPVIAGVDGETWTLSFGNFSDSATFRVWSPSRHNDERNLKEFLKVCEIIIQLAEIEFNELFE